MTFTPVPRVHVVVAKSPPVRDDIKARGARMLAAAQAKKAQHVDEGHSFVEGSMGRTDYSVTLDDTRGELAAFSMEFGTRGLVVVGDDGELYLTAGTPAQRIVTGPEVAAAAGGDSDA